MLRRLTITYGAPYSGRESWNIHWSRGAAGPWCIQRGETTGIGSKRFDPPKPEHSNFPTRKAAQQFKRDNL
jgi:hypothetical protein